MGLAKPVTIAFGRMATILLMVFIALVLAVSCSLLWEAARAQNERAAEQTRRFARVLLAARSKSLSRTIVDYANWGEAYRHLHLTVDPQWAWEQNNIGRTLKADLGIEDIAVVNGDDREVYSVADGSRSSDPAFGFARDAIAQLVNRVRETEAESDHTAQTLMEHDGGLLFAAASIIRPGGDVTVQPNDDTRSVLVFGDRITPGEVEELRQQLGLDALSFSLVEPGGRTSDDIVFTSEDHRGAIAMTADYPSPGTAMLWSLLPWAAGLLLLFGGCMVMLAHQGLRAARQGKDLAQALRDAYRQVEHQAFHDSLTGLPNRASFQNALRNAIDTNADQLTLLYLDLDHFKAVNDRFGHAAGDQVLQEVARRLVAALPSDALCSRIGGDEFVILVETADRRELGLRSRRIIRSVSAPIPRGCDVFHVGATIGIAVAVAGDDPESLMRNADDALYRAKEAGRGRFIFADRGSRPRDAVVA